MKLKFSALTLVTAAAMTILVAPRASAQSNEMEIGVLGLISDYRSLNVTNGSGGSGSVGPDLGFSGGFVLGQSMSNRWGGEFRYLFFKNDLKLDAGSNSAELGAQSHAVHYDILYYFADPDAKIRPYLAGGGGVKNYRGTGTEDPFQPGSNLALLTKTSQTKLMGDFGVGVKFRIGRHAVFRVEFRDYVTDIPDQVIAAAPGANIDGILHQFAPLFGITWTW